MALLVLLPTLLLVYCTAVCTSQECDVAVVTTSQLRNEIKSQLNETIKQNLNCNCNCSCPFSYHDIVERVTDSVKAAVSKTVGDLLSDLTKLVTPGYTPTHPACSCKEILQLAPQSPSGLYWITDKDYKPRHMYCDMEKNCKGVDGGWMKVASMNMTDPNSTCPPGLRTLANPIRLCAMGNDNRPGCSSVIFPVQGVEYSRVCGKIIGYQDKTTDAFQGYNDRSPKTIDSAYVDGISLTHGQSPRKHIWTFAAAAHEHNNHRDAVCPCTNTHDPPPGVPSFVGDSYFCDTASEGLIWPHYTLYLSDPLWDGAGCGHNNTCCTWNSPPWFRKEINSTSDDIEMRLCADEQLSNEDINFESLEIYVQ